MSKSLCCALLLLIGIHSLSALLALPNLAPEVMSACGLSGLTDDPSIITVNPAAASSGLSFSSGYVANIKALRVDSFASVIKYGNTGVFAGWQALDNPDYVRDDYQFGLLSRTGKTTSSLGMKLGYDKVEGEDSGVYQSWLYAATHSSSHGFSLDTSWQHPLPWKEYEEYEPVWNVCLACTPDKSSALAVGVESRHSHRLCFKAGSSYALAKDFRLTTSWESEPSRFGFGFRYDWRSLSLSYAVQTHPDLEWNQSLGLSVVFR